MDDHYIDLDSPNITVEKCQRVRALNQKLMAEIEIGRPSPSELRTQVIQVELLKRENALLAALEAALAPQAGQQPQAFEPAQRGAKFANADEQRTASPRMTN